MCEEEEWKGGIERDTGGSLVALTLLLMKRLSQTYLSSPSTCETLRIIKV